MGRPSTPSDIANACCYLASDEASFITGVDLEVWPLILEYDILILTKHYRLMEVAVCKLRRRVKAVCYYSFSFNKIKISSVACLIVFKFSRAREPYHS